MTSGPYGDAQQQPVYPGQTGNPAGYGAAHPGPAIGSQPYDHRYPPPYQQPYGMPGNPPAPSGYGYPSGYPLPRNGIGTAGLVLGIIGLVFCWLLWVGWALNILAIIFGGVGVNRAGHGTATNRSSAMAGLVLGVIGLVLGIALWAALGAAWRAVVWSG